MIIGYVRILTHDQTSALQLVALEWLVVGKVGGRGVAFFSRTEDIETESASGRLTFHVFTSLAQFERELTWERTMAGLDAAKVCGIRLGRPVALTLDQSRHAALLVSGGVAAGEVDRSLNVGKSTLSRALRGRAAA